jgi:cell division septation protein DedD
MAEGNKNQWVFWTIAVGAVIITLIAFNYQGEKKEVVPLSEIFPDEGMENVEYEFVTEDEPVEPAPAVTGETAEIPAVPAPQSAGQMAASSMQTPFSSTTKTANTPTAAQTVETAKKATGAFYTIQALSSKSKDSTEKALEKAKANGFTDAFISSDEVGSSTWYRIYLGRFDNKAAADQKLSDARKKYADSFVKYIK